jgi:hypothetical protein
MITRYNDYINKDTEIVTEKIDISIKKLLSLAKEKMSEVTKSIIYNSITADKQPVKIGNEYYAVFYLTSDPDFLRVGKIKIENIVEKKKQDSDKTYKVFKYKKRSIESPLEGTQLRDYKLLVSEKSTDKLSTGEITGFYLYKEEIKNNEIPEIIKRYGYNKEESQKVETELKPGNIYEITNSKGDKVELTIYKIDDKGILTGYDYNNNQKYDNYKVKNIKDAKLKGSVYDKYDEKLKNLYIDSWKNEPAYKNLRKRDDKIKFIEAKKDEVTKLKDQMKQFSGNEEITKLVKRADGVLQNLKIKIERIKNPKSTSTSKQKKKTTEDTNPNPTEKPDTNVSDKDEQKTVDDMKKGEETAKSVQAQPEKKEKKKQPTVKAEEPPAEQRVPTGKEDYAAVEKINYPKK